MWARAVDVVPHGDRGLGTERSKTAQARAGPKPLDMCIGRTRKRSLSLCHALSFTPRLLLAAHARPAGAVAGGRARVRWLNAS